MTAPAPQDVGAAPRFVCDAHLGALARWLRAAGYEAWWLADVEDARLVREAREQRAVLLTGDAGILERRPVRNRSVAALFVPTSLRRLEQLDLVVRRLGLSLRAPRCMACGGELARVEKKQVLDRIPPRTAAWQEEYFLCSGCDKLFWRGTHWERIGSRLASLGTR